MSTCPTYSTVGNQPISCGPIQACPGDVVKVSGCDACTGDQYLEFYDSNGVEVASNDQGCEGSSCSALSYVVPTTSACQNYSIGQDCYGACGGNVSYSVEQVPTTCAPYSATDAAPQSCGPFEACSGDIFQISGCDLCSGFQEIGIVDDSGNQLDYSYYGCPGNSYCASLTYEVPSNTPCKNYTISEGCYSGSCSGVVDVTVESPVPVSECAPYSLTESTTSSCGPFYACPGEVMHFSNCNSCVGEEVFGLYNTDLRLIDSSQECFPSSDCSELSYTVPVDEPCQYFMISQSCRADTCTGTTVFTVGTVAPSINPTAVPTLHPTTAAEAYVQFFSTESCTGVTFSESAVNGGQCAATGIGYMTIACDSSTTASAWTASYYDSSTCSGTPLSTASGSDPCACTPFNGQNIYVNCAGVISSCGESSSSALSAGVIAGITVGAVAVCGLSALTAAYFLGFFKASAPLAHAGAADAAGNNNL